MTRTLFTGLIALFVLLLSALAFAQTEQRMVHNVLIISKTDAFTDDSVNMFVQSPIGAPSPQDSVANRYVKVECTNGAMDGVMFVFDQYLNNGDLGEFEYRVDHGDVVSGQFWQKDDAVYVFNNPGELGDNTADLHAIFAGDNIAVRATAYDGDTDQAQYDIANLRSVLAQYACGF